MSEPLFDIILHTVEADTNTHVLAEKLSGLLGVSAKQLEMHLVKVKLSQGKSEALVSRLVKAKAERLQQILARIGLKTSLKLAVSLVPIRKTINTNKYTCPACGAKQEVKASSELHACSECGVVKEKYEELQGFKKYEEGVIKHNKLIEDQEKIESKKSTQEKHNKQLNRGINSKLKRKMSGKQKLGILLSAVIGFSAIGAGSFYYLEESKNNKTANTKIRNGKKAISPQKMIAMASSGARTQAEQTKNNSSSTDQFKELGNPYSKFANPAMQKISITEGVKQIDTLLDNRKLKLANHDKSALQKISKIYKNAELQEGNKINYQSIIRIAKTIKNRKVRSSIRQHAFWGEIASGVRTFDELGVSSSIRAGEENPAVQVSKKLIDIYISVQQFDEAVAETDQIKNMYLKAVTLNKIMKAQAKEDIDKAIVLKNKIQVISQMRQLGTIQQALVSGILAQGEILLGNRVGGELILENIQLLAKDIRKPVNQVLTLIQLSEDQREGMGLKFANIFLEDARQKLKGRKINVANKDKAYSSLAEQYARLLDFGLAKKTVKKIRNKEKKALVNKTIAIIEIKAAKGV